MRYFYERGREAGEEGERRRERRVNQGTGEKRSPDVYSRRGTFSTGHLLVQTTDERARIFVRCPLRFDRRCAIAHQHLFLINPSSSQQRCNVH